MNYGLKIMHGLMNLIGKLINFFKIEKIINDIICPVCGYNCLGKGGLGCIDKPAMDYKKYMKDFGYEEGDLSDTL